MPDSLTLLEFLEQAGAQVRAYDIGRRIAAIRRENFHAFERGTTPYPQPMQRQAWFALVQSDPAAAGDDPVIWFLRLGLDEQGLLVPAERDCLLGRLLESARAQTRGADPQAVLRDNPNAFTPREDRMALFHALLGADLGRPPSRFYPHALDYFHGRPGWDQWGFVGYQGIADVACRHADEPLSTAIGHLPPEPLVALCHCLESGRPGPALRQALIDRLDRLLSAPEDDVALLAALVRGLGAGVTQGPSRQALKRVLAHSSGGHIEVLAAIAGRAWEGLSDEVLLQAYLERLASSDHGATVFAHCVADLLSLPGLAATVRRVLRRPDQVPAVREAFAHMTAASAGGT